MNRMAWMGVALAAALAQASCAQTVCGPGTVPKFDESTGDTQCVLPDGVKGVQCDPGSTSVKDGKCVADPSKFPTCGAGTMLDPMSNTCVATGSTDPLPKACDTMQPAGTFCVNGVIRFLKGGAVTKGTKIEVRAYDPLMFLFDPTTKPQQTAMTDDGTYTFNGLKDTSGMGLIALAATDPGQANFTLAGSGADMVAAGGKYRVDLVVIEKTTVASWSQQAGLMGADTFEEKGAYLARFIDKPRAMAASGKPVAGVVLTMGGAKAPDQFFFKGDYATIDKALTATDSATGAVVQRVMPMSLTTYSGMGGGLMFETVPGASLKGVVFITTFHTTQ